MREKLIELFSQSGLVSSQGAHDIASEFVQKRISKNDFQLTNRKICNEYFFLQEGMMRAFTHNPQRQEITTAFYSPGQLVFDVSSFFHRTISKENIQALIDCNGWVITFEQLNHLFHTMPEFREFGRMILVKGFTTLKSRMLSMINDTAEERYAQLLETNPEIFQYAPLKTVASYLGITDTSLSRIRKEFKKNPRA